jgi:hypothetical protein
MIFHQLSNFGKRYQKSQEIALLPEDAAAARGYSLVSSLFGFRFVLFLPIKTGSGGVFATGSGFHLTFLLFLFIFGLVG